ncbi:MAG: GTP 3',8-cyclase MoaA [Cyanobacteriota bacterium]
MNIILKDKIDTTTEKPLIDIYKRHIHKLRVQLTDACNFRCFYCMPTNVKFKKHSELLTPNEIFNICHTLVKYFGVNELRLTGGEPTIRGEFDEIVTSLAKLNLKKFGLTTNGFILKNKLNILKENNCNYINVSLDSLQEDNFNKITKSSYFKPVFESILLAKEKDFKIKINVVAMKGVNDHELLDFINFSAKYDIEVRFLELMKIGEANSNNNSLFISAKEIIDELKKHETLIPIKVPKDSTSFNFKTSSGAKIGFIASETMPFCTACSRLRLNATGKLRACLMSESGIEMKDKTIDQYEDILQSLIAMKPYYRIDHIEQPMYQIGG